jgi:membrane-bound lytic murein transglycosylase B
MTILLRFSGLTLGLVLLLSACAAPPVPGPVSAPLASPASSAQAQTDAFQAWLAGVRAEALRKGITEATLSAALSDIAPIPRVIELDRRQPEFTQTFWRYLDSAVSEARVRDGIARLRDNRETLSAVEGKYEVPGRILTAFWGLETNYGRNLGSYKVPTALATLAFDGRRSAFFRAELFDALTIIDRGHISPDKMVGSWAGAMGQTQFMPSTFLRHAVDETGDGRIDVWAQTTDALGSGANYLRNLGWNGQRGWGREVRLPRNFDLTLASLDGGASETIKPLGAWAALGLTRTDGKPLPKQDLAAALILPAGVEGPAFLVYDNFRIILKWNRSIFYALAVGHLSDRINGGGGLVGKRQTEEPLSRDQVIGLQSALKTFGHLDAEPDGTLGSATRRALRAYQLACRIPADGYAGQKAAQLLSAAREAGTPCAAPALGVALRDSSQ